MTEEDRKHWARQVKAAREAFGMHQRELARLTDVHYKTIGNIEKDKVTPQRDKLWNIMWVLHMDPAANVPTQRAQSLSTARSEPKTSEDYDRYWARLREPFSKLPPHIKRELTGKFLTLILEAEDMSAEPGRCSAEQRP